MKTIVKMQFGSHLYGTNTPDSDQDWKSVFMPEPDDVLLGTIPKTLCIGTKKQDVTAKNTADDVDHEAYSLHYFMKMAYEGDTHAIDMLHAPSGAIEEASETWLFLQENRHRFYTRNLRSLVGYARQQAAKYGVKGSRLADAKTVLQCLELVHPDTLVGHVNIPCLEHGTWKFNLDGTTAAYEICGKTLQTTARDKHYLDTLRKFVEAYGHRARMAERNEGIDWKAVSHAFRAAYQVQHILVDGGFTYPLPETEQIMAIKQGLYNFKDVADCLDSLIDHVERLSRESSLPDRVDRAYWDQWLKSTVLHDIILYV